MVPRDCSGTKVGVAKGEVNLNVKSNEKKMLFKHKSSSFTYNLKVYIFNFLNIFQGCIIVEGSTSRNRGQRCCSI